MRDYLKNTAWKDAIVQPIDGDASSRRYARLSKPSGILMIDPDGDTVRFADVARRLEDIGLCPPEIHTHNAKNGTMIIADLGRVDFAQHLASSPKDELLLYQTAVDVLGRLQNIDPIPNAFQMTHKAAAGMVGLATQFYSESDRGQIILHDAVLAAFTAHVDPKLQLCLRDYHAQNLIWRSQKSETDRVGLLDFQDACMAPMGYDLMSLIRDARRDVDDDVATLVTAQYCALIGRSVDEMSAHLACVGVQRNLRILGIFARLSRDGKRGYLDYIPRVWGYLMRDLAHPSLSELRKCVSEFLPAPDQTTLQQLGPK